MRPFTRLTALACPLPFMGIDTDQLIPARFMSRPRSEGYGDFLLYDRRRGADGALDASFPLNDPARAGAEILVAQRNFGGGSSREAAVYALADAGFRVVIAPSFGDIFASNAVNNGVLPAKVGEDDGEAILAALANGLSELTVDLERQEIVAGNHTIAFTVDSIWRKKLLNGWDDLDLTESFADDIAHFADADAALRPWAHFAR
ncbi:3-isopropylmalate dehydratase small subunit [Acuticoccus mangrovi]|uniref:3-isopropylmalate dehydratase n=1 Tax=Acuticoccus mangrovi TaxID=2796142 RepID=A0A934MKK8_9HYPH|nr:3-isopropylmalate dehydratase small subunit [Acuticoccus mangrovi]MBJ3775559.1 3-isopropylmalate dehydratase small subunit [Acuticoccus mangrovi]